VTPVGHGEKIIYDLNALLINHNFDQPGEYMIRVVAGKLSAKDDEKKVSDIEGATDVMKIKLLPKKGEK
jgi:hypothetical protein